MECGHRPQLVWALIWSPTGAGSSVLTLTWVYDGNDGSVNEGFTLRKLKIQSCRACRGRASYAGTRAPHHVGGGDLHSMR